MTTFADLLSRAAEGDGRMIAGEDRPSFRQIEARSRRLATGLRELGVRRGDRIAAWMPNLVEYICLLGACGRLGAILVAVNTRFSGREIADIVTRAEARVLVAAPPDGAADTLGILGAITPDALPDLRHFVSIGSSGETPASPWPAVATTPMVGLMEASPLQEEQGGPHDLITIFTTSGTTSAPKFAAHRQAGVVGHAADVAAALKLKEPGAVSLQLLPFCGVFGFVQLIAALSAGVNIVLPRRFEPATAANLLREHDATHVFATDDMVHRILEVGQSGNGEGRPFSTLRFCMFGAFNAWLADLPERAEAAGIPMIAPYGMSEVMAIFAARGADQAFVDKHRAGGRPINGDAEVRARNPDSGEILGHGDIGELEIRSPNMFVEYFGDPVATADAFTEDGYLKTGDLGFTEPDRAFTYLQRMNDTLRLSGFLVAPSEIEAVLMRHSAVEDSQVVAVGTREGNRPVGFVTVAAGMAVDESELVAFCGRHLPKFKTPVRILRVQAFPVTEGPNGTKVQRGRLRELAEEALNT